LRLASGSSVPEFSFMVAAADGRQGWVYGAFLEMAE
jgi:hypothetical protein